MVIFHGYVKLPKGMMQAVFGSFTINTYLPLDHIQYVYGGFLKWGYPQVIYHRLFQYKHHPFWGTYDVRKPPDGFFYGHHDRHLRAPWGEDSKV